MTAFLEGVSQVEVEQGGFRGKLPILYYDCTSMSAIFTASTKKVREYLPHESMRPIEIFPRRCLVAFTAFEYRNTDIDAYNEFSIACLVTFKKFQIPGLTMLRQLMRRRFSVYVWHLPVTTEIARAGGVEVYGYPKFIGDIEFRRDDEWVECTLSEQGTRILTLRGRDLPTRKGKAIKYVTYSIRDGRPLMTDVNINPLQFAQSRSRKDAELDIGANHPICRELEDIGLSKKPFMYQYSPVNEAILFAGREIEDK